MIAESTRNNLYITLIVLLAVSLSISIVLMYEVGGGLRRDGWFAPIIASLIWMTVIYYNDAKNGLTYHRR
jgi:hypothetical protein